MPGPITVKEFRTELRRALSHLYEPFELRHSLLAEILPVDPSADKASALRHLLQDAIRHQKPDPAVPNASGASRSYDVLYYRYIEQSSLKEVASEMALSVRQVHRIESTALHDLTDYLAANYSLSLSPGDLDEPDLADAALAEAREDAPGNQSEMEWLRKTYKSEDILVSDLLVTAIETVTPMVQGGTILLDGHLVATIRGDITTFRQALVNLLIAAIRSAPGGRVVVRSERARGDIVLQVTASSGQDSRLVDPFEIEEITRLACQLVEINGGSLIIEPAQEEGPAFKARIVLPITNKTPVMVIDDNTDTLRLMERFLDGTSYEFIGIHDPLEVEAAVKDHHPRVIILDVMMPGTDGWQILAQLKGYGVVPSTQVVISTILPQESLAMAFGAAGFLRKPVTQERFLALLDQMVAQVGPGSP